MATSFFGVASIRSTMVNFSQRNVASRSIERYDEPFKKSSVRLVVRSANDNEENEEYQDQTKVIKSIEKTQGEHLQI